MKFQTITGSLYELNKDIKSIRRLNGANDPTPRQGKDGEWRKYANTSDIEVGSRVIIVWGNDTELLNETKEDLARNGGFAVPTTITSQVVSIEE